MNVTHYSHDFIHYSLSNIVHSLGLYITNFIFPFKEYSISTYHKAVQKINQDSTNAPPLPFLIIDPSLSFEIDESTRQTWRYPDQFGSFDRFITKPLVDTVDTRITATYLTVNLSFELTGLFESVYQLLDYNMSMVLNFGGLNRWTKLYVLKYDLPLPSKLQNVPDVDYLSLGFSQKLIPSIGKSYWTIPVSIVPTIRLSNISDGSDKYGHESLPVWRNVSTVEMMLHIITGLDIIWQKEKLETLDINIFTEETLAKQIVVYQYDDEDKLIKEIKKGYHHLVVVVDRDYNDTEEFVVDLSDYDITTIGYLFNDITNPMTYDSTTKQLRIQGPLSKDKAINLVYR